MEAGQDSTAAFEALAFTFCSGNLSGEFLLLVNSNSSARVARKRNKLVCPATDKVAGMEAGLPARGWRLD